MLTLEEPYASFYDPGDADAFRAYVERAFGDGSHVDPGVQAGQRDEILIAGLASARDYFLQSAGCRSEAGLVFRAHPGLVDTIRPNAFVTRHRSLHLCGLNTGLYGAMFELCLFVMAQPGVFTEVGDPTREVATPLPPGIVPGFWMIDRLSARAMIDRETAATLVPKCPDRYDFAVILTLHMMRFVWFHELYHCLNGHIGMLSEIVPAIRLNEMSEQGGAATLIEREQADLPMNTSSFLQAIELDADRSALWGAFAIQARGEENIFALQAPAVQLRIKACLVTSYLITVIFEGAALRWRRAGPETHPDPYTRLHNLIRTTASHLLDAHPVTYDAFQTVMGTFRVLKSAVTALPNADTVLEDCHRPTFQAALDEKDGIVELARRHFAPFSFKSEYTLQTCPRAHITQETAQN